MMLDKTRDRRQKLLSATMQQVAKISYHCWFPSISQLCKVTGENRHTSKRFQAVPLHLCTEQILNRIETEGCMICFWAFSFLSGASCRFWDSGSVGGCHGCPGVLLWNICISIQSKCPEKQPAALEESTRGSLEEPLLCRSSSPTTQPCSKRQPFVTAGSHSFRETVRWHIWCLFLFAFWSWEN